MHDTARKLDEDVFKTPAQPERILVGSLSTSKVPLKTRSNFHPPESLFKTPKASLTKNLFPAVASSDYGYERIPREEYLKQLKEIGIILPSQRDKENVKKPRELSPMSPEQILAKEAVKKNLFSDEDDLEESVINKIEEKNKEMEPEATRSPKIMNDKKKENHEERRY